MNVTMTQMHQHRCCINFVVHCRATALLTLFVLVIVYIMGTSGTRDTQDCNGI